MKKVLLKLRKSKWSKVFACCLICTVFISIFAISSSAAEYDPGFASFNYTINFESKNNLNFYNRSADLYLYKNGSFLLDSFYFGDYSEFVGKGSVSGYYIDADEFEIIFCCEYSELDLNGLDCFGVLGEPNFYHPDYSENYVFSADESYRVPGSKYWYAFNFNAFLPSVDGSLYLAGFNAGVNSSVARDKWWSDGFRSGIYSEDAKNIWYPEGYTYGYNEGFIDGESSSDSSSLGQNLIGDTLSAPLRALNQFTIFVAPNGTVITLGMIFGSLIALTLFLSFLKLFGG